MHRERGLTLIELAVTLTVLAICAAVGVPALREFARQQRAVAAMGGLTVHLASARMAAVTHNRPVVICPAGQAAHCAPGTDWSRGWSVFFDQDGDRRPNRPADVIAVEQAPGGGYLLIMTSNGRQEVRYLPNGTSAGSNVTFTFCGTDSGRLLGKVVVNNAGRARTERPSGQVPCAQDGTGTSLADRSAPV